MWTTGRKELGEQSLDLAVSSPLRHDIVDAAAVQAGAAASSYEAYKQSYRNTANDCLAQGMSFIPTVAEPSGGWGAT